MIELDDGEENEEFVTVRVESETGELVEGEPVTVIYEDESESEHETDANGEYEISLGITDGSDDVVPITVEVRGQSETVRVHDGETHEVVFTVEPEMTDAPVDEPADNETAAPGASTNESTANATG